MPKYWHDHTAIKRPDEDASDEEKHTYEINRRIVAEKKPCFMRYIYPPLMSEYNAYLKNTNMKALCTFRMTVEELEAVPESGRTQEQSDFLRYYHLRMPVGINDCTMNRICRRVEELTCGGVGETEDTEFDYTIMRSGCEYTCAQYADVQKLFQEYQDKMHDLTVRKQSRTVSRDDSADYRASLNAHFRRETMKCCSDARQLCDIVLDMCYTKAGTKRFAWDIVGDVIVENLSRRANGILVYPRADPDGDIVYRGDRFSMASVEVNIDDDDYIE